MPRRGAIHIGCSGWNYAHWRNGVFYPRALPATNWLEYYAERFDTVEINATFYRLPTRRSCERWAATTPAGFRFAVKVSRYLTHVMRLRDTAEHLALLLDRLRPLDAAGKLDLLLWQLPPTFKRSDERLAGMLAALPRSVRHAVEFRHPSWLDPEVLGMLRAHDVALVVGDRPHNPVECHDTTADFVNVRFHYGRSGRRGNYSRPELTRWAGKLRAWAAEGRDVYAYFNNDWEGFAPANARTLKRLVAGSTGTRLR